MASSAGQPDAIEGAEDLPFDTQAPCQLTLRRLGGMANMSFVEEVLGGIGSRMSAPRMRRASAPVSILFEGFRLPMPLAWTSPVIVRGKSVSLNGLAITNGFFCIFWCRKSKRQASIRSN